MKARTSGFVSMALVSAAFAAGCSDADHPSTAEAPIGEVSQAATYSPSTVANNTSKRVFMHVMPWFEAKATQHGYSRTNAFGQHWTMANCRGESNGLLNRVCADDAPLIGPYSSSDPYVVEYHLLLMKYAGVDGISIDWPGVTPLWDFPDNKLNSEAYIQRLNDFGLNFMIVSEDRNYQNGVDNGRYGNVVDGARNDLSCLKAGGTCGNTYFGHPKYERFNGVPVLATFGPITMQTGAQWSAAYTGAGLDAGSTHHIGLWYENGELGAFNDGSFAWIWQDQTSHVAHQQTYLNNYAFGTIKMASAYPGYNPYYGRGGWSTDGLSQSIAANGTGTLSQLLDMALGSSANFIQLNTWNDFGEDTVLEPSVGDGFSMLEKLQQKLGVPFGKAQLELIKRLFDERVKARKAGNGSRQNELDQASAQLGALNVSGATSIINGTSTTACGNGRCESGESCSSCASDCGPCSTSQAPFGGSPTNLPGVLALDRFDNGGEGVAYHDDAAKSGAAIRSETTVDLENANGTGVNVGWTAAGEWLEWTVNVLEAGSYTMNIQSAGNGGTFKLTLSGATNYDSGAISAVPTSGWQVYQPVSKSGISLNAGTQVVRLEFLANVAFNLKNLELVRAGTAVVGKTLQNAANGQYAYREGSAVKYTGNPATFGSAAQWTLEDYAGFKRIRNVGNGCLVHIEHRLAYAECDTGTPDGWYSNRWNVSLVGSNQVFSNAWQGTELNCFGNPAAGVQCTERGTSSDAQWLYRP